jgi:hypothetical protein
MRLESRCRNDSLGSHLDLQFDHVPLKGVVHPSRSHGAAVFVEGAGMAGMIEVIPH